MPSRRFVHFQAHVSYGPGAALMRRLQHLESLSFTPSLLHPTVHLSLGYLSVMLALGSYLYSLKVDFESSKPALWIGVGGYFTLQGALWCWKRWVERGQVFSGKRRRMVKRVRHLPSLLASVLA